MVSSVLRSPISFSFSALFDLRTALSECKIEPILSGRGGLGVARRGLLSCVLWISIWFGACRDWLASLSELVRLWERISTPFKLLVVDTFYWPWWPCTICRCIMFMSWLCDWGAISEFDLSLRPPSVLAYYDLLALTILSFGWTNVTPGFEALIDKLVEWVWFDNLFAVWDLVGS